MGAALRGIFHAAEAALPGGLLFVVVFVGVVAGGGFLLKRQDAERRTVSPPAPCGPG